MPEDKLICQNCDASNPLGSNYCSNCGQKFDEELNFKALFYNTISNYFSFDARFLKSLIPLLFKPGYIAKEFVSGRRLTYLHPGQMYLFVTVVFFFVFSFWVRDFRSTLDEKSQEILSEKTVLNTTKLDSILKADSLDVKAKQELKKIGEQYNVKELKNIDSLQSTQTPNSFISFSLDEELLDSLIAVGASDKKIYQTMGMTEDAGFFEKQFFKQGLKLYKKMELGQMFQYFIDSIPLAMFFLMPLFALILKLFYYKRGNYSHHLVFSLYFFCFLFLVFSIVIGLNRIIDNIPLAFSWLVVLSTFFYLWRAILRFYAQHWFLGLLKSGIISWIYLAFVVPTAATLLIVISFFFY